MRTQNRILIAAIVCVGVRTAFSACYSGFSDAPCTVPSARTLTVASDHSGDYATIQAALDVSQPGDRIQVKNGTYSESPTFTRSGTASLPIALVAFPGHAPVIVPSAAANGGVLIKANWIILDGFEIRQGYAGVVVSKDHVTIRNNYIHNSGDLSDPAVINGQGILVASAKDVWVDRNRIERNGLLNNDPWHVHGIYLSDYYATGVARITVSNNIFREHAGAGFHAYTPNGQNSNNLIEGNLFENNAHELISVEMRDSMVRNNTFVHTSHPATNSPTTTMVWLELSPRIQLSNNIFFSAQNGSADYVLKVTDAGSLPKSDYNQWSVPSGARFLFPGLSGSEFNRDYPGSTGLDAHSVPMGQSPRWANAAAKDYRLTDASPGRGTGSASDCASSDFSGRPRLSSDRCDMGAYFSTSATATSSLVVAKVRVYPNPWRPRDTRGITFDSLPEGATLTLFTVAGRRVREWKNTGSQVVWDLETQEGRRAASGIYLYVVRAIDGTLTRGKCAIIR